MPSIGQRCHELRIVDRDQTWRILYRVDVDAVIILEVFNKKTASTPRRMMENARRRIKEYDENR